MDKSKYLESVIESHRIAKEESLLAKYKLRNNEVMDVLKNNYLSNVYDPFNSGSYAKNTAINTKFDFDLVCPFKRNAFGSNGTLAEMYNDVFEFLNEKYKDIAQIRQQKVSVGIEFNADNDLDIVKIDVVPGREFNQNQYADDENLNLYVFDKYGSIEAGSERLKTNIQAQISYIKDRATHELNSIRKIVRLLKIWKLTKNESPAKSFLLELITIRAFEDQVITGSLWDKLKSVLEYVKDNIDNESFTLKDPGNGSNDLMETLSVVEREQIATDMANILRRVDDNEQNIRSYFPESPKFREIEENQYQTSGASLFSIPPKTNFG